MRVMLLAASVLAAAELGQVHEILEQAFYPGLLGILVIASLGVPIPEDIPLIAAGVILKTSPGVATWTGTITVALIGIMSGDLVLYSMGKYLGPGVVNHWSVRWMITPKRFKYVTDRFAKWGTWFCFFGRFFMFIRAIMCLTAGATRFPYWKFFLADFAGACLSVPFFVLLGYWFAHMIPTLQAHLKSAQGFALLGVVAVAIGVILWLKIRAMRRMTAAEPTPTELNIELPTPDKPRTHASDLPTSPADPATPRVAQPTAVAED